MLHVSVWVEISQIMYALLHRYVTLHVSVWVEMWYWLYCYRHRSVTLHVSVWVEMTGIRNLVILAMSRSTWACELKYKNHVPRIYPQSHAPRERVSWNFLLIWYLIPLYVTLHVSVWVEIVKTTLPVTNNQVTLHVSVWVEISLSSPPFSTTASRSTWACELKCSSMVSGRFSHGHAPRERVSWNAYGEGSTYPYKVTLHVSVWVEIWQLVPVAKPLYVTLHVSVWVEITCISVNDICTSSRSTWACELKSYPCQQHFQGSQSRSTWACELKSTAYTEKERKKPSRSTWACELKLHFYFLKLD